MARAKLESRSKSRAIRAAHADPEPLDENDPELREEIFEIHRSMGCRPQDLTGATMLSERRP
jgi:hypothetical protein